MWGLEKLKGNQAAQLGLLSAGAAMLDPRGTDGNTGAALNKAVRSGLNTYVPMMQWQQDKKDRKSDRDWKKQQDMIRNVLEERQFKMRKKTFEAETEHRAAQMSMQQAKFGMAQQQFQQQQEMNTLKTDIMSEYLKVIDPANKQAPVQSQWGAQGAGAQARAQMRNPGKGATNAAQLSAYGDYAAGKKAPTSQFEGMDPYVQQTLGDMVGIPGMTAQGKDRAEMQMFVKKEAIKNNIDMDKVQIKQSPLGLDYFIIDKKTGKPIGKVNPQMGFTPNPEMARKKSTKGGKDYTDYFK